jgi:hypothetical protein
LSDHDVDPAKRAGQLRYGTVPRGFNNAVTNY